MRRKVWAYAARLVVDDYSDNAYRVIDTAGHDAYLPKSYVFGEVEGLPGMWWVASWLLRKKGLKHDKKLGKEFSVRVYASDRKKKRRGVKITRHFAAHVDPIADNTIEELLK